MESWPSFMSTFRGTNAVTAAAVDAIRLTAFVVCPPSTRSVDSRLGARLNKLFRTGSAFCLSPKPWFWSKTTILAKNYTIELAASHNFSIFLDISLLRNKFNGAYLL